MPQSLASPFVYLTILSLIHFAISKPDGFSLEIVHRYSRESPFYPGNITDYERITRLVELSKIRAHNLAITTSSGFSPEAFRLRISQDDTCYLVKVIIGSPGVPLYLVPDTGSGLFWTQCEPCTRRFRQLPPIFNSTASRTYRDLPCQHQFCTNNQNVFQCRDDKCVYRIAYAGGSATAGVAAQDILQSAENDRIPFYFGCSRDNQNFSTFESSGKGGGIIGLNMSPVSLLQQMNHITKNRFSYCLNLFDLSSPSHATSLLRFGNDIRKSRRKYLSTPFVSPRGMPNYFLNLIDVSVAGNRMQIPPGTFALKPDGTGGTIIDSGTAVTYISQTAYFPVITAFKNYFDQHGFQRVNIQLSGYICYKQQGHTFHNYPSMAFHFQGADFFVEPEYVYLTVQDRGAFCVALQPISPQQRTIIGALNQANTQFIYDAANRQLLFTPENCQDHAV
ncbi:Aspartic proteinase nepenthesin-2 precursor, putative [Ricinus communis]|uniref:Aspartic proteinase nepenthesin-2, putative n=1 Tax=Ricinus communis TaxID=3988 RepID=B9SA53_RICCO|nr:Aspartic proteinase nepenthesin-2 precursor, putative [Ricinus communis]|eukprot:XP_002522872.1 aspartic proteinase nepenthesin-2 [Ricinus communis]